MALCATFGEYCARRTDAESLLTMVFPSLSTSLVMHPLHNSHDVSVASPRLLAPPVFPEILQNKILCLQFGWSCPEQNSAFLDYAQLDQTSCTRCAMVLYVDPNLVASSPSCAGMILPQQCSDLLMQSSDSIDPLSCNLDFCDQSGTMTGSVYMLSNMVTANRYLSMIAIGSDLVETVVGEETWREACSNIFKKLATHAVGIGVTKVVLGALPANILITNYRGVASISFI